MVSRWVGGSVGRSVHRSVGRSVGRLGWRSVAVSVSVSVWVFICLCVYHSLCPSLCPCLSMPVRVRVRGRVRGRGRVCVVPMSVWLLLSCVPRPRSYCMPYLRPCRDWGATAPGFRGLGLRGFGGPVSRLTAHRSDTSFSIGCPCPRPQAPVAIGAAVVLCGVQPTVDSEHVQDQRSVCGCRGRAMKPVRKAQVCWSAIRRGRY